ncbi:MAG: hypothetical protein AAB276_09635 [Pseudomonadota bacterium]
MTKTMLLTLVVTLALASGAAFAYDDGGFGVRQAAKAPAALGDNTAELIAKGEITDPNVADIEPAAGEDAAKEAVKVKEIPSIEHKNWP